MDKKREDRVYFSYLSKNKKAQITIFIILGLLLLFVSVFLIQLVSQTKKAQLESGKENIFDKIFQKEAMRIYVEDCLTDELENGLVLLGKQGRFWAGQPGGIKSFIDGETGVLVPDGNQVFYGIVRAKYPSGEENKYPCKEGLAPEFCQYQYPETSLGFGQVQLKEQTLKEDLERFLINRTIWCVENYTRTNISSKAKIASAKLEMVLQITDEGISVKADYPLKMTLGDDEFFQLTTFDFFYPTRFKEFVRAGVTFPLENDQRYVDFNYAHENLILPYFEYGSPTKIPESCIEKEGTITCSQGNFFESYNDLKIKLDKKPLSNGDDLLIFSSDLIGEVIHNRPYNFRIARQNRPPALDYIQRHPCPAAGYDYLVIKNDPGLGGIEIDLSARDPDEDEVEYSFEDLPASGSAGSVWQGFVADNKLKVPSASISGGKYGLTAKADDGDDSLNSLDWQTVRIFVDEIRPSELTLSLPSEYGVAQDETNKKYFVSKEDPVLVKFNYPRTGSVPEEITQEVDLKYIDGMGGVEILFTLDPNEDKNCFVFSGLESDCNPNDFWKQFSPEKVDEFSPVFSSPSGELELTTTRNYCDVVKKPFPETARVIVKECVPYRNPEHPWSWPYEDYFYGLKSDGTTNLSDPKGKVAIEPFLASHACCLGEVAHPANWELVTEENKIDCFVNPRLDCYAGIQEYTKGQTKYLLEEEYATCDGKRGNLCSEDRKYRFPNGEMRCAVGSWFGCSNSIPDECESEGAFSYVDLNGDGKNDGWCHGTMGCDKFCRKPISGIGLDPTEEYDFNEIAEQEDDLTKPKSEYDFEYSLTCGCFSNKVCDFNHDGRFEGICIENTCYTQDPNKEEGAPYLEPSEGYG